MANKGSLFDRLKTLVNKADDRMQRRECVADKYRNREENARKMMFEYENEGEYADALKAREASWHYGNNADEYDRAADEAARLKYELMNRSELFNGPRAPAGRTNQKFFFDNNIGNIWKK